MRILVVDDDRDSLDAVSGFLQDSLEFKVSKCSSCADALELYTQNPTPIVISDIKMKGMNGIDLLKAIKNLPQGRDTDVVLMTGFGELETCIEALRAGATDYILKPIYIHQLDQVLKKIIENQELKAALIEINKRYDHEIQQNRAISSELEKYKHICSDLIEGEEIGIFSTKMRDIVDLSLKLHADREIPVLIQGETGTGKEVIAQLVHKGNSGDARAFITINCSAISPSLFESELFGYEKGAFTGAKSEGSIGKLELAQNGTIFLDEIGDLPLDMQPKLLRAIQQKEIYRIGGNDCINLDVRFICATNQSLIEKVEKNQFRRDLFYRINSGTIYLPPLRERTSEIAPLSRMFLEQISKVKNKKFKFLDREAVFILEHYAWPGNIRELKNTLERVCLLYDEEILKAEFLNFLETSRYQPTANSLVLDFSRDQFPLADIKQLIAEKVYKMFDGNVSKAAKYLDVAWATFVKLAGLK